MFNTNFASHSFSSSFCSQCLSVARLLKNNRFLLASYFSVFLFWASLSLFLFTPGLAAVWNLIGHDVAMLACYGTEALGSHPAIGKEESEFRMVLHYNMRTILRNGNEFPEKMKTSPFFQSDIWANTYVVFIGPPHFLSAKPIKLTVFKNSGCMLLSRTLIIWSKYFAS